MEQKRKNLSRQDLKRQILMVMQDQRFWNDVHTMTMYDIACDLKRPPSTHLLKVLEELVNDGLLEVRASPHRPGWSKNLFAIAGPKFTQPALFDK